MTKRILYPIVFALLLLFGGWGNKASGQSSGATYAVRYTLPKGVSDLRCVTHFPPEGKVVVTSGRKIPAGVQLTFTATVEDGYEIDHWMVNGELAQHEPEGYGGAKMMEMEMPEEDIDVVIVMKSSATRLRSSEECIVTLESSAGGRLSALYVDIDPFSQEEDEVYVNSGDAVPKNITLEVNAIPDMGAKIGKWYQDDVAISGSEGSTRQTFVIRKDTKIKVDFETSAKPFEGYTVTLPDESPEGTIAAYYEDDNYNHVPLQAGENKVPKWKFVFLTATPKAGYEFSYWTFNGQRDDNLITKLSDNSCRYEPDADVTIGAVFKQTTPAGHKVTLTAGEGGTLQCSLTNGTEVQSGSTVDDGVALRFNARPMNGYKTDQWTINGEPFAKGKGKNTIIQKADKDLNVEVSFLKDIELYTVEYTAGEGGTIAATVGAEAKAIQSKDQVEQGAVITFIATPQEGYELDQWMVNGKPAVAGADTKIEGNKLIVTLGDQDLKVEATFKKVIVKHTVTFNAGEGGTIAATVGAEAKAIQSKDQVEQGAVITFTATPQEGYELDQWMVNGKRAVAGANTKIEGNKLIVTLGDQDLKVEATFKKLPVTYEVTYSAGEGGDIVGANYNGRKVIPSGSKVNENVFMRFTAKPNTAQGYKVDQWFINGEVQSQLAGRPYINWQIKAKTEVKVTFRKEQMYEVDYKPDNEWGTIEAYYYDGGRKVTVEPKAKVKEGTFVEFQATVKEGYALDAWTNNGHEIPVADIESLKASITLRANAVIDVKYHKLVVKHTVTFTAGEGGTIAATVGAEAKAIQSKDQVEQGAVITFTATPQEGYELDQWMVNGKPAVAGADTKIEGNKLTVTLGDQDLKVQATFKKLIVKHAVTFTAGEGGTIAATVGPDAKAIQSKDQVEQGAVITFTATPQKGYELDQWMVNGKPAVAGADTKIEGNKLIVTLGDQDLKVEATFKKLIVKHAVTFTAGEGGAIAATVGPDAKAIQSKDQVEQGAVITFTATPQKGYELDQWMVNGKPAVAGADTKIEGNKLIVTLGDQDLKVEATFKKLIVKHAVTFTAGEGGAIAATVGPDAKAIQSKDQVEQGAVITFTATPQKGYELDQWMVNGKPAVAGADTKIEGNKLIVTLGDQDLKVEATFKKLIVKHAVTFTAGEGGAIAATVGPDAKAIQSKDQVEQGAVITFTATPQKGYELDQWMVNGKPAVAGADTKIEGNKLIVTLGDQDLKVEATFKKVNAISQISEAELAVYPNPFAERVVITIPAERIGQTAYLTSMQGEVVLQMTLEQTETVLYTDALSQGTYLLRVGSQSQLLIKE